MVLTGFQVMSRVFLTWAVTHSVREVGDALVFFILTSCHAGGTPGNCPILANFPFKKIQQSNVKGPHLFLEMEKQVLEHSVIL